MQVFKLSSSAQSRRESISGMLVMRKISFADLEPVRAFNEERELTGIYLRIPGPERTDEPECFK